MQEMTFEEEIKEKLEGIAQFLISKDDLLNSIGLYGGDTGIALFFALYYEHTQEDKYYLKMEEYVNHTLKLISEGKMSYSFSGGLAGWGWFLEYLKEREMLTSTDFLSFADKLLVDELKRCIKLNEFDQLHGAIGIALYFLKRGLFEEVRYVIRALYSTRITGDDGIKWVSVNPITGVEKYDFGLAHGIAGIIYFLSKCIQKNIETELCFELINGAEKFLFYYKQDFNTVGSYFPFAINRQQYKEKQFRPSFSRLAWCYGDLGILFIIDSIIKRGELRCNDYPVEEMLWKNSYRRSVTNTHVENAGFCHGASGISYMFKKLYERTKNEAFKDTHLFWLKKTMELLKYNSKLGGYEFNEENEKIVNNGLLSGVSGVGITLLSVLDNNDYGWDECLFLS